MAYHTALKDELYVCGELDHWKADGSVVFEWDITQGLHPRFREADALYTEPSWRQGYPRFLQRAGRNRDDSTFFSYLVALRDVILELGIPSYVVMGKHMLKTLDPPQTAPVDIHGYGGLVGVWHADLPPAEADDIDSLVQYVCGLHRTVLDPCCGYGNVAAHAERFICSDINRKCVYYVAKTHLGYR